MDAVLVWWARVRDADDRLRRVLDATERERMSRYVRPVDADRFLLGAALVRAAAARHQGRAPADVDVDRSCPDCGRPHGKVRLPDGPQVSVSHSGDLVGVAVHPSLALGLDVEQVRPSDQMVALTGHVLNEGEVAGLPDGDRAGALLRCWVRKEACLKATGDGLRVSMRHLTVSAADAPAALLDWRDRPELAGGLHLYDLAPGVGDHLASLAVLGPVAVPVTERDGRVLLSRTDRSGLEVCEP
jgi:4'-phosphopantetheinyl transferase